MEKKSGQEYNRKTIRVSSNDKFPMTLEFDDRGDTTKYIIVKSKSNKLMLQK